MKERRKVELLDTCDYYFEEREKYGKVEGIGLVLDFCGFEHCRPRHSFGPYARSNYVIHFVLDGEGVLEYEGKRKQISKDQSFMLLAGETTTYWADRSNPWYYCWIGFHGDMADKIVESMGFTKENPVVEVRNIKKAELLYDAIDSSKIFVGTAEKEDRSRMNVCFVLKPEYQKKAGKAINQTYVYLDKGYYNNWDELYGSTPHDEYDDDGGRKPGSYIILDYDGDGVISQNDRVPYGFTGHPQNTVNFQIGVDYKGWSAFVQFYGTNNVSRAVSLESLGGTRNTAYHEGSYWTSQSMNADVPLPRWLTQKSSYANGTRFMYDGSYLRLKYAEISYTFSKEKWLKSAGLQSLKLYVNGNNLALWTDMPDDRESNTGGWSAYPTQRRFNLGLRVTL